MDDCCAKEASEGQVRCENRVIWYGLGRWNNWYARPKLDPPFQFLTSPRYGLKSLGIMRVFGECYLPLLGSIRVLEI